MIKVTFKASGKRQTFILFFFNFYLLMIVTERKREREREREREAETQAEGEAGSMQGARHGTPSQVFRIAPWAKGRRQTAVPPRDPENLNFLKFSRKLFPQEF